MEKTKSLVVGLWKFHERISEKGLAEMAEEWATDDRYSHLYVRKVSKDQLGIGFTYDAGGTKEGHDEYFDLTSDQLKRKFGNDLVGWDIASTNRLIKGFK